MNSCMKGHTGWGHKKIATGWRVSCLLFLILITNLIVLGDGAGDETSKKMSVPGACLDSLRNTMPESSVTVATRRSIKKYFPLGGVMSKGRDNPITLHSVSEDVFARVWSLIAETMLVTVELRQPTKEAIASMVAQRNHCPICVNAHCMFEAASNRAEAIQQTNPQDACDEKHKEKQMLHEEALEYAGLVFDAMAQQKDLSELIPLVGKGKEFSRLSDKSKAECALVVVLFSHMNRVVSVILGEEASTAMFGVPRGAARVMESNWVMNSMNKVMSPLLAGAFQTKNQQGFTATLFPEEGNRGVQVPLPNHLRRVLLTGLERSNALARLHHWVVAFEKDNLTKDKILSKNLIRFLDDPRTAPPKNSSIPLMVRVQRALDWAEESLPGLMESWGLDDPREQAIAWVLVLTTFAPQRVYQSTYWYSLQEFIGENMARLVVVWWSLRHTLKSAKGLD